MSAAGWFPSDDRGHRGGIYELPSAKEMFAIPAGSSLAQRQGMVPTPDLAMAITISTQTDRKTPGTATVWDLYAKRRDLSPAEPGAR